MRIVILENSPIRPIGENWIWKILDEEDNVLKSGVADTFERAQINSEKKFEELSRC